MNKDFLQTGATLLTSGITSWFAARHYYLSDVNKKFDHIRYDIRDLKQETNEKFKYVDKRFDDVDKRFDAVDKRFDRLETKFDDFQKDHKADFKELNADIKKLLERH